MNAVSGMIDIVESRRYDDRFDVENTVMYCIGYLNRLYKTQIKKDVVASAGDEFQGLFRDLQGAFCYIRKLQLLVYPIKLRCGVGYGEIKYDVEQWLSTAYDGETYYHCRDAINAVADVKDNIICFNTGAKFDKYLNVLLSADYEIKSRQSQTARMIEMIADIIYPLCPAEEDARIYAMITAQREKLIERENWNRVKGKNTGCMAPNPNFEKMTDAGKPREPSRNNPGFLLPNDFWYHGMTTEIANYMNTTRQNIDRYILLSKIKESRRMDKAIYDFLGEAL